MRFTEKQIIQDSNDHQVCSSSEICVLIGTRPKNYPLTPFARKVSTSRRYQQPYAQKREKEISSELQERIEVNIADLET